MMKSIALLGLVIDVAGSSGSDSDSGGGQKLPLI
jgi:hypothetical protein